MSQPALGHPAQHVARPARGAFAHQGLEVPGLALADERGRSAQAVMVALGADSATLRVGNVDHMAPLAALARIWRGEFTTLWRTPPGLGDGVRIAADGPLGGWLAQNLAPADGRALPDGLAGPLTLMKRTRASGVDEPRLVVAR